MWVGTEKLDIFVIKGLWFTRHSIGINVLSGALAAALVCSVGRATA